MERTEQITQMFFDAIGEFNQSADAGLELEVSPQLILIGDGSKLDSLGFINLVVPLVDNIENTFKTPFDLTDVLDAVEQTPCTVETLSRGIAKRLNGAVAS